MRRSQTSSTRGGGHLAGFRVRHLDLVVTQTHEHAITENQERLDVLVAMRAPVIGNTVEAGIRTVVVAGVTTEPYGATHLRDLGGAPARCGAREGLTRH